MSQIQNNPHILHFVAFVWEDKRTCDDCHRLQFSCSLVIAPVCQWKGHISRECCTSAGGLERKKPRVAESGDRNPRPRRGVWVQTRGSAAAGSHPGAAPSPVSPPTRLRCPAALLRSGWNGHKSRAKTHTSSGQPRQGRTEKNNQLSIYLSIYLNFCMVWLNNN